MTMGFDLLRVQIVERVQIQIDALSKGVHCAPTHGFWNPCESEIERLFLCALMSGLHFGIWLESYKVTYSWEDHSAADANYDALFFENQVQIGDARVDFVIHAVDYRDPDNLKWRKLVVECDGHEFHERTKEQAARDRERDRLLVLAGYDVFRFTGSQLWRDPLACVHHVIRWALLGRI